MDKNASLLDIFFDTLKNSNKTDAFQAIKTAIVKRKLELIKITENDEERDYKDEFEELWNLKMKEKVLKDLTKK